jgi:parvulin-like peptidyl-prolyl isomerase
VIAAESTPPAAGTAAPASLERARVRRVRLGLAVGAVLGFSVAVASMLDVPATSTVPTDAVAVVNGSAIAAAELHRALDALSADRREPLGDAERRAVLDRLIDEELLVERARELGLDRSDRTLRTRLVGAMIEAVLADQAASEPNAEQVAAFYRENAAFFAGADRLRVREVRVGVTETRPEAEARATAKRVAARLRAGEDFDVVARELGDVQLAPPPDALLSIAKLSAAMGPSLTRRAAELPAGSVGEPVLEGGAFHVLHLVEREAAATPRLESNETEVRVEMRRRADERVLSAYPDDLRARAHIERRQP